jgi:alpha-glucan,water dikinase
MHEDNARKVKSVIDRLKALLGEVNEVFDSVMQSKAEMMGHAFKADEYAVKLFSEEVLRGTLFFSLSMILKKIDPHVRKCAHLGDWLIISKGRSHGSRGYVEKVPKLYDVMHKTYENRTILLVDKVTGEEEVPSNVQAIVLLNSSDYPDVLAHVSVRARNLKVLLTVLFNDQACKDLEAQVGNHLVMNVKNNMVEWQSLNPNQPIARRASSHLILQEARDQAETLEPPPMFTKSIMYMEEFSERHSGAKSNNLKYLRDKLDRNIKLPESACIPFQMCEYSVGLELSVQEKLETLIERVSTIKSVKKMNRMLY